jgi:hypothetical protein
MHSVHTCGFENIGKDFHIIRVIVNDQDFAWYKGA